MKLHLDNNHNINVEERHIDTIYELGLDVQGVPVLVAFDEDDEIDDFIVGFQPDAVDALVAKITN